MTLANTKCTQKYYKIYFQKSFFNFFYDFIMLTQEHKGLNPTPSTYAGTFKKHDITNMYR